VAGAPAAQAGRAGGGVGAAPDPPASPWRPSGASGVQELPGDVARSIRQRLALLPAAAARQVAAAAVAGRRIEAPTGEVLATWLGLELDECAEALRAALQARLLVEEGEDGYRFANDLIYEAAAAELGAWRRRTAHRVIAEALEAQLTREERRAAVG